MTTTDTAAAQPQSYRSEIATLTRELAAADAKLKTAAGERITDLRAARDDVRRHIVDVTGREIARLDSDRVIAEHAAAVAQGAARKQAEAKVSEVRRTLTQRHEELEAHISHITRDTDEQVSVLKAKAQTAARPARARLESTAEQMGAGRDALAAKAKTFRQATAAEWEKAKSELDVALRELAVLRDRGGAGIN